MTHRDQQPTTPPHLTEQRRNQRAQVRAEWLALAQEQCEILSTARYIGVLVAMATSLDRDLTDDEKNAVSWMMYVQSIAMSNVQEHHDNDRRLGSN